MVAGQGAELRRVGEGAPPAPEGPKAQADPAPLVTRFHLVTLSSVTR